MLTHADKTQRQNEILGELAELGLTLARDLHARALAASDDASAADLALAFQRVSRSIRQTLALDAKLERDRRLAEREAARSEAHAITIHRHDKRCRIRTALTAEVWTEYEGAEESEVEGLLDVLDALVLGASEEDGFLDAPIEDCIARIRAALGLPDPDTANGSGDEPPEVITQERSG